MTLNCRRLLQQNCMWLIPLLLALIALGSSQYWDPAISGFFFHPDTGQFSNNSFYQFIFDYGPLPALAVGVAALISLTSSLWIPSQKKWRNISLICVLTLAIGAGFISHNLLKDHWGRPRPKQIEQFGGKQPYRPINAPNFFHQPEPSKSFPCGHCTVGFFFFSFMFIGIRLKNRPLFWSGLVLALLLGSLLGLARLAAGGHFFSDILASAAIMWMVGWGFTLWLLKEEAA